MSSNIEITKTCRWCGKEFTARKTSTEYCSHRCSGLAYKERKRQEKLRAYQSEYARQSGDVEKTSKQEFLTPTQAASLLGLSHVSIYNYINNGTLKVWRLKRKTLIRREDVNALFTALPRISSPLQRKEPITEFYTSKELMEKYGVSNSGLYEIAKREGWPKTSLRGKTLWSRNHVDSYFASLAPKEEITEWYSAAEIQEKFGMTLAAIYTLVSKEGIPKIKTGGQTKYSKRHFDKAKGIKVESEKPRYYTYPEAMEKYGLTRDQLHHYLKYHNVTRTKKGKYTIILCSELDALLGSPKI